jgi:hypothetical protein
MKNWLTAIFGAGVVGVVYSMRKYLGIALVLLVTTCSYKTEIANYLNTSRDQGHQERMAQLEAETAKAKLQADQELKILQAQQAADAQARADQLKADEAARRDELKLQKQQAIQQSQVSQDQSNAVAAGNVSITVQTARSEIARVTQMRDNLYTQYRTAQYYNNTAEADRLAKTINQYDAYIAQQQQIIRRLTS